MVGYRVVLATDDDIGTSVVLNDGSIMIDVDSKISVIEEAVGCICDELSEEFPADKETEFCHELLCIKVQRKKERC